MDKITNNFAEMKTHKNCLKCYKIIQILTICLHLPVKFYKSLAHIWIFRSKRNPLISFKVLFVLIIYILWFNKTSQPYHTNKCSCHLSGSLYNKRPMGQITHLRNQFIQYKSLHKALIIPLLWLEKINIIVSLFRIHLSLFFRNLYSLQVRIIFTKLG